MKKIVIAAGLVFAAGVAGWFGALRPEIAVASYISIVALSATVLVLTSRPARPPVGYVPRRIGNARNPGIGARAAAEVGHARA